jgi:hypothetical protein
VSVTSHLCIRNSHRALSQLGKQACRAAWGNIVVFTKLGQKCEKTLPGDENGTHEIHACDSSVARRSSVNGQLRVHPRDIQTRRLTAHGPVQPCNPSTIQWLQLQQPREPPFLLAQTRHSMTRYVSVLYICEMFCQCYTGKAYGSSPV